MITLITPTADQPTGIALCERFIARQTLPIADMQWIVVDDGDKPATLTMDQQHVRRPREHDCKGYESLCRNLLAAIPHVRGDIVACVEHDDWYAADHLEVTIAALLAGKYSLLAGDNTQRYYNVAHRCHRLFSNTGASLCQTAMRAEALPLFESTIRSCLDRKTYGIDTNFWRSVPQTRWALTGRMTCIGIKGLPGRPGLGIGHRPDRGWTPDPSLAQLREWIGEDADLYSGHGRG